MSAVEREEVKALLEGMGNPAAKPSDRYEKLCRLFWSDLNYRRVNTSLPRKGWAEAATQALADDPVLFAAAGEDKAFHVIYARLASDRLLLGQERSVVSRLLRDHPYAIFVFSTQAQDRWHFLNVQYDDDVEKRRLFRRITVGPEECRHERLRTATERLTKLDLGDHEPGAIELQTLVDEAFKVEPVTDEFFKEYARVFGDVEGQIKGIRDAERKRLFTQLLFNRLMFMAFIQKKGWLKFGKDTDYLNALWDDYQRHKKAKSNFYLERLKLLFFSGLNTASEVNVIGINRGGFLKDLIGHVPYLNGGLFEEDEDDRDTDIVIPDECLNIIRRELFNRFNFTVTESTPLDVEVAVDPEMLGKVFEELVTGRHETGSYYTPKPVVAFMCREALKGYLKTAVPKENAVAVERFVDEHDAFGLRDAEAVLEALKRVKVCDPACGSGAYLLGMLHELLALRACLFVTKRLDSISTYERKLEIIQNNVYGVDIDPFAVNVARLRLWLSLAVDFEGDDPPPLPNLDFKIEAGDSLTVSDPSGELEQGFRKPLLDKFLRKKAEYLMAHGDRKVNLRKEIGDLKQTIAEWAHGRGAVNGFDWPTDFAEVFLEGGFDVVLANPPYVRADAQFKHLEDDDERQRAIADWKEYRAALLKSGIYSTLYEKWDLYLPFLERGYQLLRPRGHMVFIISDAYNRAKYALRSHEFFVEQSRVERIDFCTEIPLFDAGVSNTIVHFAKTQPDGFEPIRVRRWGDNRDQFELNIEDLPSSAQSKMGIGIFRSDDTLEMAAPGGLVELGAICYISVGMVIHCDEKKAQGLFKAEDLICTTEDCKHPIPYVEGKDVLRWAVQRVRYLEYGTKRAPGMFRRPTFPQLHLAKEKLLAARMCGGTPAVTLDRLQLFSNHTVIVFVPWHLLKGVRNKSIRKTAKYKRELKSYQAASVLREELEELSPSFAPEYLLAVMNSTFARDFINRRRRSKLDIYPDDWKSLPVPG